VADRDEDKFSGRLTLRMPKRLHREVFETAIAERVSMNQLICVALAGALERMNVERTRADAERNEIPSIGLGGGGRSSLSQSGAAFDSIMGSMGYEDHEDD
jgi:hypothetical protein